MLNDSRPRRDDEKSKKKNRFSKTTGKYYTRYVEMARGLGALQVTVSVRVTPVQVDGSELRLSNS